MCLIFLRNPNGGRIDFDCLELGHARNPDGFGLIAWTGSEWYTHRVLFMDWAGIRQSIDILERKSALWAVHFRYATRGPVIKSNVHPFEAGNGRYLMHNGTASIRTSGYGSDSSVLAAHLRAGRLAKRLPGLGESRLLLAGSQGSVYLRGKWFERSAGWWSNARTLRSERGERYFSWDAAVKA